METPRELMSSTLLTDGLDMRVVGALAHVLSAGFRPTVSRPQAEYEMLAWLPHVELLVDGKLRLPLNYHCLKEQPNAELQSMHIDPEARGDLFGVCVQLSIEKFLQANKGDVEARLLARFGVIKIIQVVAKCGLASGDNLYELRPQMAQENCEAAWAVAFSMIPPAELSAMSNCGSLNAVALAEKAAIDVKLAESISRTFEVHAEALLAPTLPRNWHRVELVEYPQPQLRLTKEVL